MPVTAETSAPFLTKTKKGKSKKTFVNDFDKPLYALKTAPYKKPQRITTQNYINYCED